MPWGLGLGLRRGWNQVGSDLMGVERHEVIEKRKPCIPTKAPYWFERWEWSVTAGL